MERDFDRFIQQLRLEPGASASQLAEVQTQLGISFPDQYASFMTSSNGAEGPVGENAYLALWSLEEISPLNEAYVVSEFAPGLVLFGSDGGNTGYAFDTRAGHLPIVEIPLVGMSIQEAKLCGDTFSQFLQHLFGL